MWSCRKYFFLFKQKKAYEMRISDWSSDVCSSDLTSKAIAGELLALAALFVIMQAGDPMQLGVSTLVMLGMLVGLPMLFIAFGRWIVPHAPGSEFSLLVMVGFLAAFITYKLGVYYLVGAFIAGLIARLLRIRDRKSTRLN